MSVLPRGQKLKLRSNFGKLQPIGYPMGGVDFAFFNESDDPRKLTMTIATREQRYLLSVKEGIVDADGIAGEATTYQAPSVAT